MAKTLPGPEKAGGRPRSKPAGSKGSKGRKTAAAAAADEDGDSAMPDAGGQAGQAEHKAATVRCSALLNLSCCVNASIPV